MCAEFQFDVFLSHSSKDQAVVRDVAARLKKGGVRVWLDEEQIKPGDSIPAKIEEGLEHSRVLVLCMSASAFGSDWAQLESGTFRFRDPLNKERRFVPLRLDNAPIKGSLAQFLYINWTTDGRDKAYEILLEACDTGKLPPERKNQEDAGWDLPCAEEVVVDRKSRGEFAKDIKDTLAQRVGMRCSNPACRKLTIGPHSDPNKTFNFGVAARIIASFPGGPRYTSLKSKRELLSIENGVWLCQNCAKLVDNDTKLYTVALLRKWKNEAENEAAGISKTQVESRLQYSLPNHPNSFSGPVVNLTPRQMIVVFFTCALLGVLTFQLQLIVGAVFLSLAVAVGLFGFLGGTAHVENRWGKFAGSVAAFVATLLILLNAGGSKLVDIKGSVYVDGQPATKATVTLLETQSSDNRREINEGNPGFFEFRGISAKSDKVKFRVIVDAPAHLPAEVVERSFDSSHVIRIDMTKAQEISPATPSITTPEATPLQTNLIAIIDSDTKKNRLPALLTILNGARHGILILRAESETPNDNERVITELAEKSPRLIIVHLHAFEEKDNFDKLWKYLSKIHNKIPKTPFLIYSEGFAAGGEKTLSEARNFHLVHFPGDDDSYEDGFECLDESKTQLETFYFPAVVSVDEALNKYAPHLQNAVFSMIQ